MTKPQRSNLVLFDFDGTLTHDDMFTPFVLSATSGMRKWLGSLLILPFYILYKVRVLPAWRMRPIASFFSFVFAPKAQIQNLGAKYAQVSIEKNLRPQAKEAIQQHQRNGDTIVVVSASLNAYLKPWCQEHGFELLCSELESRGSYYTGFYKNGDCSRDTKASRVLQHYNLSDYQTIYAYGDTPEDFAMLKLANIAMYNWKPWKS